MVFALKSVVSKTRLYSLFLLDNRPFFGKPGQTLVDAAKMWAGSRSCPPQNNPARKTTIRLQSKNLLITKQQKAEWLL